MFIDITRLKNGIDSYIEIDRIVEWNPETMKNTGLLELKDTTVRGTITKDSIDSLVLDIIIEGTMILPCAITLKPVSYPFTTSVQGNIENLLEEIGEIDKKMENTIDIFPIVWENILVEIPSRVVSEDADSISLEGNGWRLCTEEQNEEINPELQKLRDLLK